MKKRARGKQRDSFPVTLGLFLVGNALAVLFLIVTVSAIRAQAFYIGWCGPVWRNYNGDGFIRYAKEPGFFLANVTLYGLLGVMCAVIALTGLWHLLTRFRGESSGK